VGLATLRAVEDYTNKYKVRVFMRVCRLSAAVRPHRDHTAASSHRDGKLYIDP